MKGLIFKARAINLASPPRIDCHLHTSWTDGESSVEDIHREAINQGLEQILFSEHSRVSSVDWFSQFAQEVRCLSSSRCKAFVGTEVKINSRDGEIDTCDEIASQCDYVMASVHRMVDDKNRTLGFNEITPEQAVEIEFALSWEALTNPRVDILGHMFGMSYRRFNTKPSDEQIESLVQRAAENRVAVEINSYYHDEKVELFNYCCKHDALVSFGSNAHTTDSVGEIVRQLEELI